MRLARPAGLRLAIGLGLLVGSLALVDLAVSFCADRLLGQGRVLQSDAALGWRYIPGLTRSRKNVEGRWWRIEINALGYRGPASWHPQARRRILILGDSFTAGEGVNLDERFDAALTAAEPTWSVINLGVSGYGTDQALIAGRPFYPALHPNDVVILLTYTNDFYDLLRHAFAGRSKPWCEEVDGVLREHPPRIGLAEQWRNRSYLAARLLAALEPKAEAYSARELARGLSLYQALVRYELQPLTQRGIQVVIAYHGDHALAREVASVTPQIDATLRAAARDAGATLVRLDEALAQPSPSPLFFTDGHWSPQGHAVVGRRLLEILHALPVD